MGPYKVFNVYLENLFSVAKCHIRILWFMMCTYLVCFILNNKILIFTITISNYYIIFFSNNLIMGLLYLSLYLFINTFSKFIFYSSLLINFDPFNNPKDILTLIYKVGQK